MFDDKSRYKNARLMDSTTTEFKGIRARDFSTREGVIEHTITETDRIDNLARHYYNDDRAWWKILDANPKIQLADTLFDPAMVGQVILIPKGDD